MLSPKQVKSFRQAIYTNYHTSGRRLPWRETDDPYKILVSEVMLQQTQVERVVPKYLAFIKQLPNFNELAKASVGEVLTAWQGLGYNRRGLYLKRLAEIIVRDYGGRLPHDVVQLEKLPGIGPATARSIAAFAFNRPVPFIETNIRSVYLHFFFPTKENVHDAELLPLVEQTVDRKSPRKWYNALMDYGATLKREVKNPNTRSKHYTKQSAFVGSTRQLRGEVIRRLSRSPLSMVQLIKLLRADPKRVRLVVRLLIQEGMVVWRKTVLSLP